MTDKEKAHKIKKIDRQMKLIALEGKLDPESKRKFINRVGNIIFYNEDEIENNFYCWEKGTYRFDVWHWFDEKLPNGIAEWTVA